VPPRAFNLITGGLNAGRELVGRAVRPARAAPAPYAESPHTSRLAGRTVSPPSITAAATVATAGAATVTATTAATPRVRLALWRGWPACPRRFAASSGNTSRSTTVTVSKESDNVRAASGRPCSHPEPLRDHRSSPSHTPNVTPQLPTKSNAHGWYGRRIE
jgi:hypothetical protein